MGLNIFVVQKESHLHIIQRHHVILVYVAPQTLAYHSTPNLNFALFLFCKFVTRNHQTC